MKNFTFTFRFLPFTFLILFLISGSIGFSQCINADFEQGNFSGWSGTNCKQDSTVAPSTCAANTGPGTCAIGTGPGTLFACTNIPCTVIPGVVSVPAPNPFLFKNLSIGAINQASNNTPENSQFIMSSGFDAIATALPVVCPGGGAKSGRLGNAQANGGGESLMYKYTVTSASTSFTYNYAVVLNDGGHGPGQQPYFRIRMWAYNSPTDSVSIDCATYDVDAGTAKNIGGFNTIGSDVIWKPWSSVTVPLDKYIGKQVSIQFITRDCCPTCDASGNNGTSGGGHFAFAYIDASCSQLQIIPSASAVCAGQNVTLTAPVGAATYSWSGPAGGVVSGGSTNVATIGTPGTYTVTMTTLGNSPCTYSLTAVMPPNLAGGANVSVNSVTTCVGGSAILTASGGLTYTWAPNGEVTPFITVPTAAVGTTSYTVTGSSASCGSGSAVGSVTVSPVPTSPFTVTSVCVGVGSTITYTGNASAGDTYTWNFGGGTILSGSGQGPYSVSWPSAGSKNVTLGVAIGNCNSPVTTNAVTVSPLQNATFSYNPSTVCKLGGTNPQPTLAGTPGGTFACAADANLIINPNSGIIDIGLTPVGTYTVTYTLTGPCPDQKSFVINIVDVPVADFTLGTYCQNEANPKPTFVNGGTAGTFSSAPGLKFVSNTTGEINLAASTAGTYTVTNSINSPGCPAVSDTSVITINPIPITTVNSQTVCAGSSATLTAGGADTYVWSDAAASTTATLTDSPASTKSYTVTGNSAGCTSSATGTITVNPYPIVTVNSATICEGAKPATLTASGAATYSWSNGPVIDNISDSPASTTNYTVTGTTKSCSTSVVATITVNPKPTITVNSPAICQGLSGALTPVGGNSYVWSDTTFATIKNITPVASKTYTVYGSTANCSGLPTATAADQQAFFACWTLGCINSAVATVTLIQKPVIVVNSPTICIGQTTTLTANGGATYTWSGGGQSGNTLTVNPLTTTSYTVSDNTAGCSGSATSTVTVNPLPVVTVNSATICAGQSGILTASGAATYLWSNSSVANPLVTPLQNTTTYTVIGTSAVGCKDTAITTVTVNPLPVISSSSTSICEGLSATITASGAATYVWSGGGATTNPLTVSPTKTTAYTVTGTDAKGCIATGTGIVTVFPKPGADFSVSPQPAIASYPTITFTNKSSKDVNYWLWDFGDGDTLAPGTANPVHTYPTVEATYTVTLNVLNAGFCPNSVTHQVVIGPEYSFFIPNAFSPNGDGENDTFFGKGKGIIEYELMIFDRWGNFIFYADDINKGWDGKANGGSDISQQDTYVWKVNLTDVFKKKHSFIGTVTLIKGE